MSGDARDESFRLLLDAVRKFNSRPSMARRDVVKAAARQLAEVHDSLDTDGVLKHHHDCDVFGCWQESDNPGDTSRETEIFPTEPRGDNGEEAT